MSEFLAVEEACLRAITRATRFLERLGLQVTTGAEIEWYAEMKPLAQADPARGHLASLLHREGKAPFIGNNILRARSIDPGSTLGESAMRKILVTELETKPADPDYFRAEWLRYRIAERCREERIPVNFCTHEGGKAMVNGAYRALQLEADTATASPLETVDHTKRLRATIADECERHGVAAHFDSQPAGKAGWSPWSGGAIAPSGTHVHFGVRRIAGDENALLTAAGDAGRFGDHLDAASLAVMNSGGVRLSNPFERDYPRLNAAYDVNIPHNLGIGEEKDRKQALRRVGEPRADRRAIIESHREWRVAGGETPAAMIVAGPVLAVAVAAAKAAGLELPSGRWRSLLLGSSPQAMCERLEKQIRPEHKAQLFETIATWAQSAMEEGLPIPRTIEDADRALRRKGGTLGIWEPDIVAAMPAARSTAVEAERGSPETRSIERLWRDRETIGRRVTPQR